MLNISLHVKIAINSSIDMIIVCGSGRHENVFCLFLLFTWELDMSPRKWKILK